ncbi:MAG TPA: SoxS protein [Paracoccus sp. (in: a-proteobacteria)]|nr:SoxS protein [Paracoccus sp. (in: a-proteobacteria)]
MKALSCIAALAVALAAAAPASADTGRPAPYAQAPEMAPARDGLQLIMVDHEGCSWCRAWKREILPGYHSRAEGRAAPLTIVQIDGPWPDGVALARAPFITPTFILLRDRKEVARIEGYAGKQHFWPLMSDLLEAGRAMAESDRGDRG